MYSNGIEVMVLYFVTPTTLSHSQIQALNSSKSGCWRGSLETLIIPLYYCVKFVIFASTDLMPFIINDLVFRCNTIRQEGFECIAPCNSIKRKVNVHYFWKF